MFSARVDDLQSSVFATGHTIPNCKHPPRLELRIVDYKSTVLPIELQVQENCELLLRLDGSIAAHSKDLFTFKLYLGRPESNRLDLSVAA